MPDSYQMDQILGVRPAPAWHGWLDHLLVTRDRTRWARPVAGIVAAFAVFYGTSSALVGSRLFSPSWYMPIILFAAVRFRYVGAAAGAVVATLLAGPLKIGATDAPAIWVGRGLVFAIVGVVTAALIDRIVAGKERELVLAEQERDLAVRQAAVIATVSHEFRTPLTVIAGVARTLEIQEMVAPEAVPLLEGLKGSARRLTDLVNTIGAVLDGADSDTFVRLDSVVLRDVLTHVLLTLGVREPKSRVTFQVDPDAEIFVSDRELLSQLLRHILDNAVKFSPERELVQVRFHRSQERLLIRVLDRGPGISDAVLRSVDPFARGDRSSTRATQGIGLGLFAAERIAKALGGSIAFLPRPGGGTEVVLELDAPGA